MSPEIAVVNYESPVGELTIVGTEEAVTEIHFPGRGPAASGKPTAVMRQAVAELGEYFAGARRSFGVPLSASGTEFQRRVWAALSAIPYGTTTSYGEIARAIDPDDPLAARAVGSANGQNPIPIIVPCHRVIGADGSLTGFGGGLPLKRKLLDLEASGDPAALEPGWQSGQLSFT